MRNFQVFVHGQAQKNCFWKRNFGWGACHQRTAQTAQFQVTEIISGASQHPKDVPFVRVLAGIYGLGTTTPK